MAKASSLKTLVRSCRVLWFDVNGRMLVETDPLKEYAGMEAATEVPLEVDESLLIKEKFLGDFFEDSAAVIQEISPLPELLIHIGTIDLSKSPLLNDEFRATQEVNRWWDVYEEKCRLQTVSVLEAKIKSYRKQLEQIQQQVGGSTNRAKLSNMEEVKATIHRAEEEMVCGCWRWLWSLIVSG